MELGKFNLQVVFHETQEQPAVWGQHKTSSSVPFLQQCRCLVFNISKGLYIKGCSGKGVWETGLEEEREQEEENKEQEEQKQVQEGSRKNTSSYQLDFHVPSPQTGCRYGAHLAPW